MENLYQGGAAALTDVEQARRSSRTARTQAEDMRLRRAQTEHAIAVLVGREPFRPSACPPTRCGDAAPPTLDPGLPSTLLERRPDVAEAERRVAGANARSASRAPRTSRCSPAGSRRATKASPPRTGSRRRAASGPSGPEFAAAFSRRQARAQTQNAKAVYDEQVANYRNAVLAAYQDVEDNLAALRELGAESGSAQAAVQATGIELEQAQNRYRAGIATYLEVSSAETAALQARLAAVNIQVRRLGAGILLVKALGGGWRAPAAAPAGG